MKNPNPQEGYAPDLFSEHARAAQLGLRVLEILRAKKAHGNGKGQHPSGWGKLAWIDDVEAAARELGLLDAERTQ